MSICPYFLEVVKLQNKWPDFTSQSQNCSLEQFLNSCKRIIHEVSFSNKS